MNDAGVAPPGVIPIQQPTSALRTDVNQYLGSFFHVSSTTLASIRADLPLNAKPSSMVSRISPMPNSPITAIRKSKPFMSGSKPNVMRNWPVTLSMPMAASVKPRNMAASVFQGEPLLIPTKLQKVSSCTAKNSGGPNFSANLATNGAVKVIMITATRAPKNDDVKAAVSAAPASPCCAIG